MSVVARAAQIAQRAALRLAGQMPGDEASASTARADTRPDVIVVVTDDMRDSDWQALPQTRERLGARGTTFPNFILTTSVCSPSRISLLTGTYAHHHGVTHNKGAEGGFAQFQKQNLGRVTIASILHQTGYRTGLFGKFLNGVASAGEIPGGWDEWLVVTNRSYYHTAMNDNGAATVLGQRSAYATDVLATRARDFIRATPANTPFLLWFTPRAPHGELQPRRQDRGKYRGVRRERSPDVMDYDNSGKPADIRGQKRLSLEALDSLERKRLDMLAATDDAIAAILDTAESEGRLANTVVFVLSDNGYMLGSHRCEAKGFPYRGATQVTMLAAGPPFAKRVIDERVIGNIDIAPTIAALAGVALPDADGVSLFERTRNSAILVENFGGSGRAYAGLRTADELYVENGSGERELYDYRNDPYELDNLLADWNGHTPAARADVRAADFSARLRTLRRCAGAACH